MDGNETGLRVVRNEFDRVIGPGKTHFHRRIELRREGIWGDALKRMKPAKGSPVEPAGP